MSRPLDDRGAPSPDRSATTLQPPEPPITGRLTYSETKTINVEHLASVGEMARTPVTVTVDGDKMLQGAQKAEALVLLGISEEVLDEAWRYYAYDVNRDNHYYSAEWGTPYQRQLGMGWQVDVEVVQDRRDGVEGLANIDPRSAPRWVTFRAKKWFHTQADLDQDTGVLGAAVPPPTGWTEQVKMEPLEAAGAVSAEWRSVEESEIESTSHTSDALLEARMELGNALKEIQVAIKVADAAWQGPRSEAAKFKFGLEYEVIGAAWRVADEWRQYLDELGKEQNTALEHSEQLKRELIAEGVLLLLGGVAGRLLKLAFSAGRAATTALAGTKVLSYAEKIARISGPLRSKYGALAASIGRSKIALTSTRILARTTGGMSVTAAVNGAAGRPTTGEDWLMAFSLAAGGQVSGEVAGLIAKIKKKHGVTIVPPALHEPVEIGADNGAQTAIRAATNQALGAPLAIGVLADSARAVTAKKYTRVATEVAENDPAIVERAMDRYRKTYTGTGRASVRTAEDRARLQTLIDEEVDAVVDGKIDPALDVLYGAYGQDLEKVHDTATRPAPQLDLPGTPTGTVAQRVRSHR